MQQFNTRRLQRLGVAEPHGWNEWGEQQHRFIKDAPAGSDEERVKLHNRLARAAQSLQDARDWYEVTLQAYEQHMDSREPESIKCEYCHEPFEPKAYRVINREANDAVQIRKKDGMTPVDVLQRRHAYLAAWYKRELNQEDSNG